VWEASERYLSARVGRAPSCLALGRVRRALSIVLAALVAGCGAGAAQRPPSRRSARTHASHAVQRSRPARGGAALRHLLRQRRPVYCGGSHGRAVALTFDDGPGPYTHLALEELRRWRARGTFFLVGKSIRAFPSLPRREAAAGAIGDHTDTHPLLPALGAPAMRHELAAGQAAAQRASGRRVRLFRPPYGSTTPRITATARRLGMVEILWSIDSGDALFGNFHVIAARVRQSIGPGSIVLFHDNRGQTIRALRSLLPYLRRRRLRAVTVSELLAADPPSASRLRRGLVGCARHGRLTRFGAGAG
jgi:peptidoglycan-N-acetylglucosamine deacetylase